MGSRVKITEVDVKILRALLKDARISFAEIANQCNMSTSTIRSRFIRMRKCGIITGSTIRIKPKKIGLGGLSYITIESEVHKEKSILAHLEKMDNIFSNHVQIGKHNIISIAVLKKIEDLGTVLNSVKKIPHVDKAKLSIVTAPAIYNPENLNIESFKGTICKKATMPFPERKAKKTTKRLKPISIPSKITKESGLFTLDKIDLSIIRMLSRNARSSFRMIANELGITTKTVIERYEKLKKEVISSSTITINLFKLGYNCNAIFWIKTSKNTDLDTIAHNLAQLPNVIMVAQCSGEISIFAIAPLVNFQQLFRLKEKMSEIQGIRQIELLIEETYSTWPNYLFSKIV